VVYPLVALAASLAGVMFQRTCLDVRDRLKVQTAVPPWFLPCCGGFATWIIGSACFMATGKIGVFGLGYHDLSEALSHGLIWWIAGILVVGKLFAFIASYSCGDAAVSFRRASSSAACAVSSSPPGRVLAAAHTVGPHRAAAIGMAACLCTIIRPPDLGAHRVRDDPPVRAGARPHALHHHQQDHCKNRQEI
jgi:CIC family chloride channel protein